jgi:ubiquinone/menaquinone biosynthesis C-methylase UbiE
MAEEIREAYDKRAPTYDETTFHRDLAEAYVTYVDPKPGESLLDLACGTGLVTFNLARILQPREDGAVERRGKIVGVDISRGMLDVARRKLEMRGNEDEELRMRFIEGDIAKLDGIEAVEEGGFDIITVCSALVLMPEPREAVRYWASDYGYPEHEIHARPQDPRFHRPGVRNLDAGEEILDLWS